MSAGTYDIVIEQGATFERTMTIKDSNDDPIDLTGFTFTGQVRKTYSSSSIIISFTFEILNQVSNTGQVKMKLTSSQTSSIPVDKADNYEKKTTIYCYDVEMDTGSVVDRIIQGTASISPEVTRV